MEMTVGMWCEGGVGGGREGAGEEGMEGGGRDKESLNCPGPRFSYALNCEFSQLPC